MARKKRAAQVKPQPKASEKVTGPRVRSIAGRVLAGGEYTEAEVRTLAASCVGQSPEVIQHMLDQIDREASKQDA